MGLNPTKWVQNRSATATFRSRTRGDEQRQPNEQQRIPTKRGATHTTSRISSGQFPYREILIKVSSARSLQQCSQHVFLSKISLCKVLPQGLRSKICLAGFLSMFSSIRNLTKVSNAGLSLTHHFCVSVPVCVLAY